MMIVTLAHCSSVHYFSIGNRVEWRPSARWYTRVWRWITKGNYRIYAIDYDIGALCLERCR